jgi:restriction system protein
MSRRTGQFEDLMELAARLPGAVSVILAAALYVGFHLLAGMAPAGPTSVADLGPFAVRQFVRTAAALLQYVFPLLLLVGALASFVRRRYGASLLAGAAVDPATFTARLSWQDFERLIGASFEKEGFTVTRAGGGGADGGVDLVLTKGRETTLVQCKQWRGQNVGVTTVRELYGVMAARSAARGIVVSAGDFTPDARDFVRGRNIDLVSGRALAGILRGAASDAGRSAAAPTCPKCGARMLERVARRGSNAGQSFWGCETFPRCRATLPVI